MSTRIKVEMQPINRIVTGLGVDKQGDVQMQLTRIINKRITKYMQFRSGALATKLKIIKSPTEIQVIGPYARVMYYGKVMEDPKLHAAGFKDADGQWKSRRGVPKIVSDRPINYDKSKHAFAGPNWDKRMMANEGAAIRVEIQHYVDMRGKK